jgi:hypothetical protein
LTFTARVGALLVTAAALGAAAGDCQAGITRYCDPQGKLSAEQKDKLLRFGGVVKTELENSGASVALIARSGLDLARFGFRYSHAGVSLKGSPDTPWAVRQLYYACDEGRPRIFDQGMSAFVLGTDEPAIGYVSLVFVPAAAAAELERTTLDRRLALQLLGTTYTANAYPYSVSYQNCNQWVVELLATAWGGLGAAEDPRTPAQQWLRGRGYEPSVFDVGWPLMWVGALIPWVRSDDHPAEDTSAWRYRVSMPASIEAFVHATVPGATRVEICHNGKQVVVHRGWEPVAEGCQAGPGDEVVALD